ncbi:Ca2+:H+ antiporter [Sporothrix brasiliensis 5110]|uniref:Vacuolar calcium ion transporter n=1 Tax=Sporothrix brasiliensis 5110 TaxID=1398154 RepID=A0A0C2F884_9PEZI|nr:Ca2+:H+ antiporter [Sporothrix brasiliensis 5110]KIH87233.1 Ca2+:H+ antiporter [Sporothrix brasiliensis 5110]
MPQPHDNPNGNGADANKNVDNEASVAFRRGIQRAVSGLYGSTDNDDTGNRVDGILRGGAGNEAAPLLVGAGANSRRSTSGSYVPHVHSSDEEHGFARRLFFDKYHTPGYDSSNVFVRYLAHVLNITKATLYSSPVNVLLVFVPIGIVAGALGWSAVTVFTLNFFAIIPLAAVLSFATEEISVRLGESLGGLLNATFGNAVELIVSIVALRQGQIEVVQSSMLGSILSNLLLVLGMCFLLGGIWNMRDRDNRPMEQSFATVTAQTSCSLMALSMASLIIPATLYSAIDDSADKAAKDASILVLSRGTAIILLCLYVLFLFFQLRTHSTLFDPETTPSASVNGLRRDDVSDDEDDSPAGEEEEEPHMNPWSAAGVLVVVTLLVSVCAEYLVDSIDEIVASGKISKSFIGLILLPIVGNAAEHVTACVVATRNKMDLALGVALGSSIQIALLVTPFLVIVGWLVLDQPMSLRFETFETVVFALSVLVVAYTVQDGKSNYLEGAMLMGMYIIIALAFYVSPGDALDKAMSGVYSVFSSVAPGA